MHAQLYIDLDITHAKEESGKLREIIERTTSEDIKAAWIRAAKELHPDVAGGDGTTFRAAKRAFEVLSDPARRAVYDGTGEIMEKSSVSTEESEEFKRMMTVLAQIIGNLVDHAVDDFSTMDINALVLRNLGKQRGYFYDQIREITKKRLKALHMLRKMKAKNAGNDPVRVVIQNKLSELLVQLNQMQDAAGFHEKVIALWQGYDWDAGAVVDLAALSAPLSAE